MAFKKGDRALLRDETVTGKVVFYDGIYREPCVGVYEGEYWFDIEQSVMAKFNFETSAHICRKSQIVKWYH